MSLRRTVLLLSCVALAALPARADGLTWERQSVAVDAAPGQTVVHVEFPFRNAGPAPVSLTSIEPSCHCTSASTSKTTYAPGEADTLVADVDLKGQSGSIEKSVLVKTDAPNSQPVTLTIRIRIPPAPR